MDFFCTAHEFDFDLLDFTKFEHVLVMLHHIW